MALNLLPLGTLGAVETNGAVTFGLWLPWVSVGDGNAVTVVVTTSTQITVNFGSLSVGSKSWQVASIYLEEA